MTIYVVRHGQTDLNVQHRLQGRHGLPLNAAGILQAHETAAELRDVRFDFVFSSPQTRAVQTAEIVSNGHYVATDSHTDIRSYNSFSIQTDIHTDNQTDICTDIRIDSRLDVFDVGDADGKIIDELGDMRFGLIPDADSFSGVEREEAFLNRVFNFMDELKSMCNFDAHDEPKSNSGIEAQGGAQYCNNQISALNLKSTNPEHQNLECLNNESLNSKPLNSKPLNPEHLNILIAGHKCTTGAIDCYFCGLPNDGNFFSRSSKNGKYKIYVI